MFFVQRQATHFGGQGNGVTGTDQRALKALFDRAFVIVRALPVVGGHQRQHKQVVGQLKQGLAVANAFHHGLVTGKAVVVFLQWLFVKPHHLQTTHARRAGQKAVELLELLMLVFHRQPVAVIAPRMMVGGGLKHADAIVAADRADGCPHGARLAIVGVQTEIAQPGMASFNLTG